MICAREEIQTGTGRGGESIYGPTFEDEIHPGEELDKATAWCCKALGVKV